MSLIELCGRCFYIGIPFGVSSKINEHHMDTYKQMVYILMYESHVYVSICMKVMYVSIYMHAHTHVCKYIDAYTQSHI